MQVKRMGWRKEPTDIRDIHATSKLQLKAGTTPPSKMDLTKYCSPIKDQGNLGSCTANAGAAMVEFMEKWKNGKYIDASRLFIYKTTRLLMGDEGIGDSGAYIRTTLKALTLFGAPPEELIPYNVNKFDLDPGWFAGAFASNYQALKYLKVDSSKDQNVNLANMKHTLSLGYPIQIGFNVYQSYDQSENSGEFPYPSKNENMVGGHSVLIVGYDDNGSITNDIDGNTKTGAFKIRNSWGISWGQEGYGWIPYQYLLDELLDDCWTIQKQEWTDLSKFD